jgi:hypothetical protein
VLPALGIAAVYGAALRALAVLDSGCRLKTLAISGNLRASE